VLKIKNIILKCNSCNKWSCFPIQNDPML